MSFSGKEWDTRICSVCGEFRIPEIDHSECAKVKKEMYADTGENKNPRKKLSKAQTDKLERYFRDVDR